MQKQVRHFEVEYDFSNWKKSETELTQLKNEIDELIKLGAKYVDISAEEEYGVLNVRITAYAKRMETDNEFQERINLADKWKERIKARELARFNHIKNKYSL